MSMFGSKKSEAGRVPVDTAALDLINHPGRALIKAQNKITWWEKVLNTARDTQTANDREDAAKKKKILLAQAQLARWSEIYRLAGGDIN